MGIIVHSYITRAESNWKNLLEVTYICFVHSILFRGLNKFERKFVKSVLRGEPDMTPPVTPPLHLPSPCVVYSCAVFVLIGTHGDPPVGISGDMGQIFYLNH